MDTFTVSTSERFIDPGTVYELPVPLSDPSGGFLVYSWEEKSGEAVRFTVRTDAGRTILDEVQVRSEGRLYVSEASRLSLCWDNASAWLKTLNVRYSVKVVSDRGVQNTLRTRLSVWRIYNCWLKTTEVASGGLVASEELAYRCAKFCE